MRTIVPLEDQLKPEIIESKRLTNEGTFVAYPYSHAYGRCDKALINSTIWKLLEETGSKKGDSTAVISVHENVKLTFHELLQKVDNLAYALANCSIKKGDVVAVMSGNSVKNIIIQYACAKLGAIYCPINAYYKENEISACLDKIKPKMFFIPGADSVQEKSINQFFTLISKLDGKLPQELRYLVLLDGINQFPQLNNIESITLNDLLFKQENMNNKENFSSLKIPSIDEPKSSDPAILHFTSGTTGPSKAALLSHSNLINNTKFIGVRHGLGSAKTILCQPLPMFHSYGSVLGNLGIALFGTTLVLTNYRYDAESTLKALINYECTNLLAVPTMLLDLAKLIDENKIEINSLKIVHLSGTLVPEHVVATFRQSVPSLKKLQIIYGTTETNAICGTISNHDSSSLNKLDNVGNPIEYAEVKIVHTQTKETVKIGEEGEVMVKGPHVFMGYYQDNQKTQKVIQDGWYNTGDLASMDQNGIIRIVGRTKDLIIRGGMNIYPREIEETLESHPLIHSAAVCGISNKRLGEEICAWIKKKDAQSLLTDRDVKLFCKDKIAYFKLPRFVVFVDDFPCTASGKVQREKLKEMSAQLMAIKH